MKRVFIIAVVAVVAVVIIAGGSIGYNLLNPSQPTPSSIPASAEEEVRDSTIMFIAINHTETQSLTTGITWGGGKATPEDHLGYETYIYTGNGWNVTIGYPVVPNPIYEVSAIYTPPGSEQVTVNWQGTLQNETVIETSYTYSP